MTGFQQWKNESYRVVDLVTAINNNIGFRVNTEFLKVSTEFFSLDPKLFSHYRPVSNTAYLGKLTERHGARQLSYRLSSNNILDEDHSAYRLRHSTEKALFSLFNDLLMPHRLQPFPWYSCSRSRPSQIRDLSRLPTTGSQATRW